MNENERKLLLASAVLSLESFLRTEGLLKSVEAIRAVCANEIPKFDARHLTAFVDIDQTALESNAGHLHVLARQVSLLIQELNPELGNTPNQSEQDVTP